MRLITFSLRGAGKSDQRSEEHTSELQSQSNLVCRLLLEKKKKKKHVLITQNRSAFNFMQSGEHTSSKFYLVTCNLSCSAEDYRYVLIYMTNSRHLATST